MNFVIRVSISLLAFILSCGALAGPVCSGIFTHDFARDPVADLNHQGFFESVLKLDRRWMFAPKWTPQASRQSLTSLTRLPLSEIRFMQNSVSNNFSDRNTVLETARNIRDGKMDPRELPPIHVWQDSEKRIWTLDHRRLAALMLSGKIESVEVQWASPAEVQRQSFKMNTLSDGNSLVVLLKDSTSVIVSRPYHRRQFLSPLSVEEGLHGIPLSTNLEQLALKLWDLKFTALIPKKNLPVINEIKIEALGPRVLEGLPSSTRAFSSTEILFSQSILKEEAILNLAQKMRSGEVSVKDLRALRVWQDQSGRVWTLDNDQLAAIRLSGYIGVINVQWYHDSHSRLASMPESMTGGLSVLLRLPSHNLGIVIQ